MNDTERINWLERQDGGALVNDDAGRWAFASDGIQNVSTPDEPFDLASTWWVEDHAFKPTIREAIDTAIKNEI